MSRVKFAPYAGRKWEKKHVEVIVNRPGTFIYVSFEFGRKSDLSVNFNGKCRDESDGKIVCRHLAYAWLMDARHKRKLTRDFPREEIFRRTVNPQSYYRLFASGAITHTPELMDNPYDKRRIAWRADRYFAVIIKGNGLGVALHGLCSDLAVYETKHLTFSSQNHLMAIVLQRKVSPDRYIVKFYDPNRTVVHSRAVCANLEYVKALSVDDFVTDKVVAARYFAKDSIATLALYERPDCLNRENVEQDFEETFELSTLKLEQQKKVYSELLYMSLYLNKIKAQYYFTKLLDCFNGPVLAGDIEFLMARDSDGAPGLYKAMALGCADAVQKAMQAILGSELETDQKARLLEAKNDDGEPGMFAVFRRGYADVVEKAVEAILSSDLKPEQKVRLLEAKNGRGDPGLYKAFCAGHAVTVQKAVLAILGSDLKSDQKFRLLEARGHLGDPGLCMAFVMGYADVVEKVMQVILCSKLEADQKLRLLGVRDYSGAPGLFNAFLGGQTDTVEKAFESILASELETDQKIRLLEGRDRFGRPMLLLAARFGHAETALAAMRVIKASSLDDERKYELLLARCGDGITIVDLALPVEYKEALDELAANLDRSKGRAFCR